MFRGRFLRVTECTLRTTTLQAPLDPAHTLVSIQGPFIFAWYSWDNALFSLRFTSYVEGVDSVVAVSDTAAVEAADAAAV